MEPVEKSSADLPMPTIAVRTAQLLVLSVLILIATVLPFQSGTSDLWILRPIYAAFILISGFLLCGSLGRIPYIYQLGIPPVETPTSFRFQNGCCYLSGTLIYCSYYLCMAEGSVNMFGTGEYFGAIIVAGIVVISMVAQFPTLAQANVWAEQFSHLQAGSSRP
jgi:hypothetical protein